MPPVDSGDKAEGASADESESGAREIKGGMKRRIRRTGGALFTRKKSKRNNEEGVLKDGVPLADAVISGRFRIVKLLAKGGMGTVWIGKDLELDRQVAVKFMDPSFAEKEELRGRFTREARAAAKLRTKHVVEIHEYGVDGTTPFIVMELLEGEDLHAHLKRVKRVPLQTAASIVVQCCRALKVAGDANIVHRDLKPGNVYLSRDLDEIVVKILDFGVAKLIDAEVEVTRAGTMLGSPQYMSPEQAVGEPVDHRSDLWSLAAIIFRMVTGKLAFSGKSAGDIIIKLCTAKLPVPSQIRPEIPEAIDKFFVTAFGRDPDERFQSASELSAAFVKAVAESTKKDPHAFDTMAKYADLPSARGKLVSNTEGLLTPPSYPGVSGVMSPVTDPSTGDGSISASELTRQPAPSIPPDSGPPTGVTRAADLVKADRASAKASNPGASDPGSDLAEETWPPRLVTKSDDMRLSEVVVDTQHRGLPAVVWVLFIAAIGLGAFLAFFFQSKPETGSLLDNMKLKPPPSVFPNPSGTVSAANSGETVFDPLEVTPDPSGEAPMPSVSASASAAPSPSAGPGVITPTPPNLWPRPNPTPRPEPDKPLPKDPYD